MNPEARCRVARPSLKGSEWRNRLGGASTPPVFPFCCRRRTELRRPGSDLRLCDVGAGAGFLVGAGITFVLLNGGGSTSPCDQSANQDAIGSDPCLGLAAL